MKSLIINKIILKSQEIFKSDVFMEEINKIPLSSNDHKRIRSVDLVQTYACGTKKDLIRKQEETICNNIIKQYKK